MKFNIANLIEEHFTPNPAFGGSQVIYRFKNNYGASVVSNKISHGLELAVLKFSGPHITDYNVCYETPVTNNVIGHLTPESLEEILNRISELS
jgi:hypothetical protein